MEKNKAKVEEVFIKEFKEKLFSLLPPGISLSSGDVEAMALHWHLIEATNRHTNLTAIKELDAAIQKHYLDSLFLLPWVNSDQRVLDIGSGAGFPGIPLAIAAKKSRFFLLDSSAKRCAFLEECRKKLGLENITVLNSRAEKAGRDKDLRETFKVVTARAVGALPVLLEYALPFVEIGGLFISPKGPALDEELAASPSALEILGGKYLESREYRLPGGEIRRLAFFLKEAPTPLKYPRREGMPEKKPLL